MKTHLTLLLCCMAFSGCASSGPAINQSEVLAVARQTIAQREGWPESRPLRPNITQSVCYQTEHEEDGHWKVTAHKCIREEASGNMGFEPHSQRIIQIDRTGRLQKYTKVPD